MMKSILIAAATSFAMTSLPARAEDKPRTTYEAKRNADGTVDTKSVTTKQIGPVTDTRVTEKTTTHDLVGGGTTTTVDKTHEQSSPGHKNMKRHHQSKVKRDKTGKAVEVTTKAE